MGCLALIVDRAPVHGPDPSGIRSAGAIKHNGTFRHKFEQMVKTLVKHSIIFRVEPIFAAVRRGQPH